MTREEIKKTLKENDIHFDERLGEEKLYKILVENNLALEKIEKIKNSDIEIENKEEELKDEVVKEIIDAKEQRRRDKVTQEMRSIARQVANKFKLSSTMNNTRSKNGIKHYDKVERENKIEIYDKTNGKLVRIYRKSDFKRDDYKRHADKYINSRKYLLN